MSTSVSAPSSKMDTVKEIGFAMQLKAVPIKLDNITRLLPDGSNFDLWEADITDFLTFIPGASHYLRTGALPTVVGYNDDMANGVNSVMHWTIDRQLSMRIQKFSMTPCKRMEELRRLFSGVSYANRLSLLSQLTLSKYDPSTQTLDVYFAHMSNIRDHLEISGMTVNDDVFAGILALGVPNDFPDIAHTFEASVLAQPKTQISASEVMRTMTAGDVSYKRNHPTASEAMKITVGDGKKDVKDVQCHYCSKQGHYARDCRKKQKDKKDKKPSTEVGEAEPEVEDVDIGFNACVYSINVEISRLETNIESHLVVFNTGATHHVFNNRKYFNTFTPIAKLPVKMANGSIESYITGVGDVAICNQKMKSQSYVLRNVYLCETLRHSLMSGIAFVDDGGRFESNEDDVDLIFSNKTIVTASRDGRRWIVEAVNNEVTTSVVLGDYLLWHRIMGHPNEKVLKKMVKDQSCVGLPERLTKTVPCEDCAVAKLTKI